MLLVTATPDEYARVKRETADLFRVPLPDYPEGLPLFPLTARAAVYFGLDWSPYLVRFDTLTGTLPRMLVEWTCVRGLRPVYAQLGQAWPGRRLRYRLRGFAPLVTACLVVGLGCLRYWRW